QVRVNLCVSMRRYNSDFAIWGEHPICEPGSRIALLACKAQLDPEAAAFAWLRFRADIPTHPLDHLSNDGQPHARSFIIARQTLEQTEQSLLGLLRDSNAVVFDPDPSSAIPALNVDVDFRPGSRFHKFHRVAE